MKRLHISTENILERATLERESGVIKDICVMRSLSLNGRRYTQKAMDSAANMVGKSFWNHETAGMGSLFGGGPRDVRDMLGKLVNGRQEGDAVFADLHIRKKWRDEVFELAENYSDSCGFSIVARGVYAEEKDAEGNDIVEDIEHLYSTDLVDEPATTHSMFERLCEKENKKEEDAKKAHDPPEKEESIEDKTKTEQAEGGENDMLERLLIVMEDYCSKKELKGITEDAALEKLREMLSEQSTIAGEQALEIARLNDEIKVSNEALVTTEKERDAFQVEVEAYKTKEEKEAQLKKQGEMIAKAIEDAGLSEEDISEATYNVLLKLTEEEVVTMLETINKTVGGVHSSGKERKDDEKESEGDKTEKIDTDTFVKKYMKQSPII
jgi:hypothetical protein